MLPSRTHFSTDSSVPLGQLEWVRRNGGSRPTLKRAPDLLVSCLSLCDLLAGSGRELGEIVQLESPCTHAVNGTLRWVGDTAAELGESSHKLHGRLGYEHVPHPVRISIVPVRPGNKNAADLFRERLEQEFKEIRAETRGLRDFYHAFEWVDLVQIDLDLRPLCPPRPKRRRLAPSTPCRGGTLSPFTRISTCIFGSHPLKLDVGW